MGRKLPVSTRRFAVADGLAAYKKSSVILQSKREVTLQDCMGWVALWGAATVVLHGVLFLSSGKEERSRHHVLFFLIFLFFEKQDRYCKESPSDNSSHGDLYYTNAQQKRSPKSAACKSHVHCISVVLCQVESIIVQSQSEKGVFNLVYKSGNLRLALQQ